MAISNLTGQKTSKTFQNLMQISSSGKVYDGLGNLVTFLQLTSSFASGSAGSGGTGAGFPFSGSAVITGSLLVSSSLIVTGSLRVSDSITGSLFGTSSWAQNSISSSYPLAVTGSSLVSTYVSGGVGGSTTSSIFIGNNAGQNAGRAINSNFLGSNAGNSAASASSANFFGSQAGQSATNAANSNFLGNSAGFGATNAIQSNFFGGGAGLGATNANYSNFLGNGAGQSAASANSSNFLGVLAGGNATNANNSNFLGAYAGAGASNAPYSTLIGYQVGYNSTFNGLNSIGSNNIIIGTNITLASLRKDSINLGGIIFATGSYSNTGGNPYSGSQFGTGRVGINVTNPTYTLEVGGTVAFPNIPNTNAADVLYRSNTGEISYAAAPAPPLASVDQINTPDTSNVFIRPDELEQSKHTTHNIYNNLNFT